MQIHHQQQQHNHHQHRSNGTMRSRNWLVLSVIFLMFCFSINLCIIVNESSREAFEDMDTTQPDFDLMAGLTKTWFRNIFEGAPTCDPIDAKDISYTLVTQMSMDRFWLEACSQAGLGFHTITWLDWSKTGRWTGPYQKAGRTET